MHGLRLGDNAVRQLENLRCRKIHTDVRTRKIWCNSTPTQRNQEKRQKEEQGEGYNSWKRSEEEKFLKIRKEKERPLRFLFLAWALTAEITRFMASARRAADPVKASTLYLLSFFFSLSIFSLFLSFFLWLLGSNFLAHQTDKCEGNLVGKRIDLPFGP